ncbi:hypothetical protein ACN1NW_000455 [Acinetobacter baumannii]
MSPMAKSKYNWSKVPEWVNWIATNESGFAFGHAEKPVSGWLFEGFWYLGGTTVFLFWPRENPCKDDWRNSLEQRPEGTDGEEK